MDITSVLAHDYVTASPTDSIETGIAALKNRGKSEGYCVDDANKFLGKFLLVDILGADDQLQLVKFCVPDPIVLSEKDSVLDAVNIATDFIGESMPVVSTDNGCLLGVIAEADIFRAYTSVQKQTSKIEHN